MIGNLRAVDETERKVLLIDDSWVLLEGLREALTQAGYRVRLAADGASAHQHLAWAELVVVDFHMPHETGAQLLPKLKADLPRDATVAFYLYTSDPDVARKYADYGFDGGFLKKGDTAALLPQLEAAFRTIKLRQLASSLRKNRITSSKPPGR